MTDNTLTSIIDSKEVLDYLVQNNLIDLPHMQEQIMKDKQNQFISQEHSNAIFQNGRGYVTYITENGKRKQVMRKNKDDLLDFLYAFYRGKERGEIQTVRTVYEDWIGEKKRYKDCTDQSLDRYDTDFDRFFNKNEFTNMKITDVKEKDITLFYRSCISDFNLTKKTSGNLRTILKGIFKFSRREGYTRIRIDDVFAEMDIPNSAYSRKNKLHDWEQVYPNGEREKLMNYLYTQGDVRSLSNLLCFYTGLRIGELTTLKYADLHGNLLSVTRSEKKVRGNDGKWKCRVESYTKTSCGNRDIIIPEYACDIIEKLHNLNPKDEYLCSENGKRIRGNAIRRSLMRACDKLGILYRSPHKIRKTYASNLYDEEVSKTIIKDQMGHGDISTTEKNYVYSTRSASEKASQINDAMRNYVKNVNVGQSCR